MSDLNNPVQELLAALKSRIGTQQQQRQQLHSGEDARPANMHTPGPLDVEGLQLRSPGGAPPLAPYAGSAAVLHTLAGRDLGASGLARQGGQQERQRQAAAAGSRGPAAPPSPEGGRSGTVGALEQLRALLSSAARSQQQASQQRGGQGHGEGSARYAAARTLGLVFASRHAAPPTQLTELKVAADGRKEREEPSKPKGSTCLRACMVGQCFGKLCVAKRLSMHGICADTGIGVISCLGMVGSTRFDGSPSACIASILCMHGCLLKLSATLYFLGLAAWVGMPGAHPVLRLLCCALQPAGPAAGCRPGAAASGVAQSCEPSPAVKSGGE
jgi:hypothetical protein